MGEYMTEQKTEQLGNIILVDEPPRTEIVKIKRLNIDSLSNWFDLKNYDFSGVDRLDLRAELEVRRQIFFELGGNSYLNDNDRLKEIDKIFPMEWLKNALDKKYPMADLKNASDEELLKVIRDYPTIFNPMAEIKNSFIINCAERLEVSKFNITAGLLNAKMRNPINDSPLPLLIDVIKAIKTEKDMEHAIDYIEWLNRDLVSINLNLSDDAILEGVQKWLIKKRKENKGKAEKRLSDKVFTKVMDYYKIIAYIDLFLWKIITGNKLSNGKIAKLLYQYDDEYYKKGSEFVRQTVQEEAENLLRSEANLF